MNGGVSSVFLRPDAAATCRARAAASCEAAALMPIQRRQFQIPVMSEALAAAPAWVVRPARSSRVRSVS